MPIISRGDNQYAAPDGATSGLIPIDYATTIIQMAQERSMALSTFRQVRMPTAVQHLPVLDTLPIASWVNGEPNDTDGTGGEKNVTEQAWKGLVLTAEEIAAIVVIPEAVLEDASIDLWAEISPRIAESIGSAIDLAVFAGTGKPASWPAAIVPAAIAAGNVATTTNAATPPTEADYNEALAYVEEDGFMVDQAYASVNQRAVFRGLNASGVPIYLSEIRGDGRLDSIYGVPILYDRMGSLGTALAVLGDPNMAIMATRTDIQYKVLDQATLDVSALQNGSAMVSLAQQDAVALRVRARFGFAVANPPTKLNTDAATRYPFSVVRLGV